MCWNHGGPDGHANDKVTGSTISETELWAAIDAAVDDPDILSEKPPGWFTAQEYAARKGITRDAARSRLDRRVENQRLDSARIRCATGGGIKLCRIYRVKS